MRTHRGWIVASILLMALGCSDDEKPGPQTAPANQEPDKPEPEAPPDPGPDGRFVERGREAGLTFRMTFLDGESGTHYKLNLYDHGAGGAVADYDGDGDDDLYFCNQLGPNALYRNDGTGKFTDVTDQSGPIGLGDRVCVQPVFNDIDNDGDQDLFVTSARGGNALFRNDGKGKFEDITKEAGVTHVGHTQGATFFDADHDGDLDLLITNTAHWTTNEFNEKDRYWAGVPDLYKLIESKIELNIYYRNDGTGKFEDATEEAGLKGVGWGGDTIVFDYDEDGDTDLLVGNMFGHSLLYDNDGKGKFKIVTYEVLGRTPLGTVGAHVLDFDGDGHLDFYLVDMHSDMWIPVRYPREEVEAKRKYDNFYGALRHEVGLDLAQWEAFQRIINVDKKKVFFGNGLFRFVKPGQFEEISGPADAETFWPWGVAVGDFDGDGDDDVFLPSGMGYPYFYWPSRLLMNDGGKRFVEEGKAAGLDPPPGGENLGRIRGHISTRSARSASVGDFNGDGRLDLIVVNFNDRSHLYMNEWPATNYVKFRLTGTKSNRDAIGATLRVHCGDRVFVGLVAAAGGYLAQSSKDVHFGLGAIDSIDRCEIRWPSGVVQVIEKPAINKTHKVVEPAQ